MRNAETVLGIIHERGKHGLPLEDIYRQLFNPDLYLRAYARLYTNKGALTPGVTGETVDGMSRAKIDAIIEALRFERYRWTPVRRVYIPKSNGKVRPLGLPTWSDKLLGDVVRSILEAYYEPQFRRHSHGFRPGRGCHTALDAVKHWTGTRWFVEGDLAQCFDRLDHEVLLGILAERLHDNRLLRLIASMLKAGYLENWTWHATLSGSPQGSVVSPVLSNVYLDRLDQFVEDTLLPAYTRGTARKISPAYKAIKRAKGKARQRGDTTAIRALTQQQHAMSSGLADDPTYRRLWYVRYADDFLLGFIGPKAEAEAIKRHLRDFLRDTLKLELSEDKTLITHARTEAARFLGYEIVTQYADDQLATGTRARAINGKIGLRLPAAVVEAACRRYMRGNEPAHRSELIIDSDYAIVARYQAEYRGLVQYYRLAPNVSWFARLHHVMETSLLKTLAGKHKSTVMAMVRKHKTTIVTPEGPRRCLQVVVPRDGRQPLVAQFGGIPLRRDPRARPNDVPYTIKPHRNDLLTTLLADTCEMCGHTGDCEVHHIRKLADLRKAGRRDKPEWVKHMAARRRKTLVVCRACHLAIHAGRPVQQRHVE
jgi:group II intron reverse transcriptase/maturase